MPAPRKRILIVDKDPKTAASIARALAETGLEPALTKDRVGALDLFQRSRFSAVLINVDLGDEDGRSVCSAIRGRPDGSVIPVLFFGTGEAKNSVRTPSDALAVGGDYFFRMPIDYADLANRLNAWTSDEEDTSNAAHTGSAAMLVHRVDNAPTISPDAGYEARLLNLGSGDSAVTDMVSPLTPADIRRIQPNVPPLIPWADELISPAADATTPGWLGDQQQKGGVIEATRWAEVEDARTLVRRGEVLRAQGEIESAIDAYQAAAGLYEKMNPGPAIALYKLILHLDPSRIDIAKRGAQASIADGRKEDAYEIYRRCAIQLEAEGELFDATELYRRMSMLDPADDFSKQKVEQIEQLMLMSGRIDVRAIGAPGPVTAPEAAAEEAAADKAEDEDTGPDRPPIVIVDDLIAPVDPTMPEPDGDAEDEWKMALERAASVLGAEGEVLPPLPSKEVAAEAPEPAPDPEPEPDPEPDPEPETPKPQLPHRIRRPRPRRGPSAERASSPPVQTGAVHDAYDDDVIEMIEIVDAGMTASDIIQPDLFDSRTPVAHLAIDESAPRFGDELPYLDDEELDMSAAETIEARLPPHIVRALNPKTAPPESYALVAPSPTPPPFYASSPPSLSSLIQGPVPSYGSQVPLQMPEVLPSVPLFPDKGEIDHPLDALMLLGQVRSQRSTGVLRSENGVELVFAEGQPSALRGGRAFAAFADLVLESERVTPDAIREVLRHTAVAAPRTLSRALVDKHLLHASEAFVLLDRQLEEALVALLATRERWSFDADGAPVLREELVPQSRDIRDRVLDLIPRTLTFRDCVDALGGTRAIVRATGGFEGIAHSGDRRFILLLDGRARLTEAIELAAITPERGASIALVYVMFGLATVFPTRVREPSKKPHEVEAAAAAPTERPRSVPPAADTLLDARRSSSPGRTPAQRRAPIEVEARLKAFAERTRTSDYFAILGVRPNADPDEIREAHRTIRFELRLDELAQIPDLMEVAREVRRSLDEARDVLLVPELRAQYQRHLKPRT